MSVAFDCFWWWRAEFGGLSNPYIPAAEPLPSANEPVDTSVPGIDDQGFAMDQSAGFSHLPAPNNELRDPFLVYPSLTSPTLGRTSGAESVPDHTAQVWKSQFPDWQWAADFTFPEMDPVDMQIPIEHAGLNPSG